MTQGLNAQATLVTPWSLKIFHTCRWNLMYFSAVQSLLSSGFFNEVASEKVYQSPFISWFQQRNIGLANSLQTVAALTKYSSCLPARMSSALKNRPVLPTLALSQVWVWALRKGI